MRKRLISPRWATIALWLLLYCLPVVSLADSKTIRIAADPWCPYNCSPEAQHQGFMVDIARAALALEGLKLEYSAINWARAKLLVKSGKLDGVIGMIRAPKSEPLYHFPSTALGFSQICFYKRANDPWHFESVSSLESKTLGWINQYWFGEDTDIDQWVEDKQGSASLVTVAGGKVHRRLISMIKTKRIDTFAEDRQVVNYMLQQEKLENEIVSAGCSSYIEEVHLAFSLNVESSAQWAAALDRGINTLAKQGKLNALLKPYGLDQASWKRPFARP